MFVCFFLFFFERFFLAETKMIILTTKDTVSSKVEFLVNFVEIVSMIEVGGIMQYYCFYS